MTAGPHRFTRLRPLAGLFGTGHRTWVAVALWVAVLPGVSGCAGVLLVGNVAAMAKAWPSDVPRWVETNRLSFAEPPELVCTLMAQVVERHDRKIIERDASSLSLRVSYPFSWMKNNWGGTLKLSCLPSEFGTTVTVDGDGRDVVPHVRDIGDEILDDLGQALRRQPRML